MRTLRVVCSVFALSGIMVLGAGMSIASAASTGSISGTISLGATPESGVCVTVVGNTTGFATSGTSLGDGTYTVSGLPPDSYEVEFDPSCDGTTPSSLAIQFYDDESDLGTADPVAVGASNVSGINASLVVASSISGTVRNGGAVGIANVCVLVYTSDGYLFPTPTITTSSGGGYSVGNLPPAIYKVLFDPTCEGTVVNSPYAMQYYNAEPDFGVATTIDITTPGSSEGGTNATLAAAGSISGTVSAPGAANAAYVCVYAFSATGGYYENLALTGANGAYDITNLPADSYKVGFDPSCEGFDTSDFGAAYYNGAASFPAATTLTLATAQNLTGINDTLGLAVTALAITTTSLPAGALSSGYSSTVQASGGTGPYDWSASGLPPGLSINPSSGAITGTPGTAGSFLVTVTVTDASTPPLEVTTTFSLAVPAAPPATTTTTTLPATETVCSFKTKTVKVDKIDVKKGKKVVVVTHKNERVYKTVTVRKVEKIHGKKVVVVTHKKVAVKTCRVVTI